MVTEKLRFWAEAYVCLRPIADVSAAMLTSAAGGLLMLSKDDAEHQIPEPWRSKFRQIAEAFVAGDFQLRDHPIDGVMPVDSATAKCIADNVSDYGEVLAPLNDETWKRSVYNWMDGYWQMLVDLTTETEPVSDLALHTKLYEDGFQLEIYSVHVP